MTNPPSDTDVLLAATRFRLALDAVDRRHWRAVHIDNYPRGACGRCTELLGRYLREELGIEADYVAADFDGKDGNPRGSHAWLELNGLIIDISGDQFGWPPVIVSRSSPMHSGGEEHMRQPLCSDERWWALYCSRIWAAAKQQLHSTATDYALLQNLCLRPLPRLS